VAHNLRIWYQAVDVAYGVSHQLLKSGSHKQDTIVGLAFGNLFMAWHLDNKRKRFQIICEGICAISRALTQLCESSGVEVNILFAAASGASAV
jgi:hypothetical protein